MELSPDSKSAFVPEDAMSSPETGVDAEVPSSAIKRPQHSKSPGSAPESEDEGQGQEQKMPEQRTERRGRKRKQRPSSPQPQTVPHHLSPEGSKHLQNLDRIVFRTHSKNLGAIRKLDTEFGDAIVVEHCKNGGADVLHIFPENLPQMKKSELQSFATKWFVSFFHFYFILFYF